MVGDKILELLIQLQPLTPSRPLTNNIHSALPLKPCLYTYKFWCSGWVRSTQGRKLCNFVICPILPHLLSNYFSLFSSFPILRFLSLGSDKMFMQNTVLIGWWFYRYEWMPITMRSLEFYRLLKKMLGQRILDLVTFFLLVFGLFEP